MSRLSCFWFFTEDNTTFWAGSFVDRRRWCFLLAPVSLTSLVTDLRRAQTYTSWWWQGRTHAQLRSGWKREGSVMIWKTSRKRLTRSLPNKSWCVLKKPKKSLWFRITQMCSSFSFTTQQARLDISLTMESPCQGRAIVDIKSTLAKHPLIVKNILPAHVISGCDTVASYFGLGKGTFIKVLKADYDLSALGDMNEMLMGISHQHGTQ